MVYELSDPDRPIVEPNCAELDTNLTPEDLADLLLDPIASRLADVRAYLVQNLRTASADDAPKGVDEHGAVDRVLAAVGAAVQHETPAIASALDRIESSLQTISIGQPSCVVDMDLSTRGFRDFVRLYEHILGLSCLEDLRSMEQRLKAAVVYLENERLVSRRVFRKVCGISKDHLFRWIADQRRLEDGKLINLYNFLTALLSGAIAHTSESTR